MRKLTLIGTPSGRHIHRREVNVLLERDARLIDEGVSNERGEFGHGGVVSENDVLGGAGQVSSHLAQKRRVRVMRVEVLRADGVLAVDYVVAIRDILILRVDRRDAEIANPETRA